LRGEGIGGLGGNGALRGQAGNGVHDEDARGAEGFPTPGREGFATAGRMFWAALFQSGGRTDMERDGWALSNIMHPGRWWAAMVLQ
jgi:hypothetical protein